MFRLRSSRTCVLLVFAACTHYIAALSSSPRNSAVATVGAGKPPKIASSAEPIGGSDASSRLKAALARGAMSNKPARRHYHSMAARHPAVSLARQSTSMQNASSNASCADKVVDFRVLGEQWLDTVFLKSEVKDPPKIGKWPLSSETSTSLGTKQFKAERGDNAKRFDMLKLIAKTFKDNGITYWLSAGTLLGTYRHGDLIPWDDDGDVVIPYEQRPVFFQKKVVDAFAKAGLQVQNGMFCNAKQYIVPTAYLKRYVRKDPSALVPAELQKDCTSSKGFFSRIDKIGGDAHTHIDVWNAFPVTIEGKTLFSIGLGNWLFSRQDVLPVQSCWLQDVEFKCPARTKLWLTKEYNGKLAMPYTFDTTQCKLVEPSRRLAYASKWNAINVKDFADVPQLYLDDGDLKLHLPDQYKDEVVKGEATLTKSSPPAALLSGSKKKMSSDEQLLALGGDADFLGPPVLPSG